MRTIDTKTRSRTKLKSHKIPCVCAASEKSRKRNRGRDAQVQSQFRAAHAVLQCRFHYTPIYTCIWCMYLSLYIYMYASMRAAGQQTAKVAARALGCKIIFEMHDFSWTSDPACAHNDVVCSVDIYGLRERWAGFPAVRYLVYLLVLDKVYGLLNEDINSLFFNLDVTDGRFVGS